MPTASATTHFLPRCGAWSKTRTCPAVGGSNPRIARISVVLPAPLGPSMLSCDDQGTMDLRAGPSTVEGGTLDLFVSLMRKRARFHPVEVLVEPDGRFVIGDGHHRTDCEPAMRLHPSADLAVRIAGA